MTKQAEYNAKSRDAAREIQIPVCANRARREACKLDFRLWLETYKPRRLPYSPDHLRVIERMQHAVLNGGMFVLACWRSFGKTMLSEDCAEWAALNGHKKFVLLIGATQEAAQEMVSSILSDLEDNDMLYADYPEVCHPIRLMEGRPQRAASQSFEGARLHAAARAGCIQFPYIAVDKDRPAARGQIIKALGLTGRLRGLKHKLPSGAEVRPDLAIPDDPQTDQTAVSMAECDKRERLLTRAVAASGGPGSMLSVIMPCTVITTGDLSDRFLDGARHPEYMRERCGLVQSWPKAQDTLWEEYARLRSDGISAGDSSGAEATAYYAAHREEMDEGAVLAWPEWVEDGEISALQHVENMLIKYGKAGFAAECQNEPLKQGVSGFKLTAETIISRTTTRPPWAVPDGVAKIVCASDVNWSYGLKWVVVGFESFPAAHVLGYGMERLSIPAGSSEPVVADGVCSGLTAIITKLKGLPFTIDRFVYDLRGWPRTQALRFGAESARALGLEAVPMEGWGARHYNPGHKTRIGTPREQSHEAMTVVDGRRYKWVAWHADYWKEHAQRGWTTAPASQGSCTLPAGNHDAFAEEIVNEPFIKKDIGVRGYMEWVFATKPGAPHDYNDCMAMAYAAAAWCGIGTAGAQPRPRRIADRRVCRVPLSENPA